MIESKPPTHISRNDTLEAIELIKTVQWNTSKLQGLESRFDDVLEAFKLRRNAYEALSKEVETLRRYTLGTDKHFGLPSLVSQSSDFSERLAKLEGINREVVRNQRLLIIIVALIAIMTVTNGVFMIWMS